MSRGRKRNPRQKMTLRGRDRLGATTMGTAWNITTPEDRRKRAANYDNPVETVKHQRGCGALYGVQCTCGPNTLILHPPEKSPP